MPLVDYSDSDGSDSPPADDSRNPAGADRKRKREELPRFDLPPLPDSFHDLYASNVRASTQDDPGLHGGRQRQTPHVEGNWPTHVYIEWYPAREESSHISRLIESIQNDGSPEEKHVHSLLISDLGAALPLHISLSRSISLTTEQRQPFLDTLEQGLADSRITPFELVISGMGWVPNFEGNRWFFVLQVEKPANDGLNRLLHTSNKAAEAFGKPPLYMKPRDNRTEKHVQKRRKGSPYRNGESDGILGALHADSQDDMSSYFHISIAWTLDRPTDDMRQSFANLMEVESMRLGFKVSVIKAKVGNAVTSFLLAARKDSSKGIL